MFPDNFFIDYSPRPPEPPVSPRPPAPPLPPVSPRPPGHPNDTFWVSTRREGLTNPNGSFNIDAYSKKKLEDVKRSDTKPTWVDARHSNLPAFVNFGSGSDRLILGNNTGRFATRFNEIETINMGKGHDNVTHTGRIDNMLVDLGEGNDLFIAQQAYLATINLGSGNDVVNIRSLNGYVNITGDSGRDVYRLDKFSGRNTIHDFSGPSKIDFTDLKKNSKGEVINDSGFPLYKRDDGKWDFKTQAGKDSGSAPTPAKTSRDINSVKFVLNRKGDGFSLVNNVNATGAAGRIDVNTGDAKGHEIIFENGSIKQDPNTGKWIKTEIIKYPPLREGQIGTALHSSTKMMELDEKTGEWKPHSNAPGPNTSAQASGSEEDMDSDSVD